MTLQTRDCGPQSNCEDIENVNYARLFIFNEKLCLKQFIWSAGEIICPKYVLPQ